VPMLREYTVFNVDQCENLPARIVALGEVKPRNGGERDATIDEFLAGSGATIQEGFGEAYYRPGDDVISRPRFEAFKNAAHFYSTAFHELGHQPRDHHEALYDVIPGSGVGIEVFFSDRTMESFGRVGAGWFWWRRRRGFAPEGARSGPFATGTPHIGMH